VAKKYDLPYRLSHTEECWVLRPKWIWNRVPLPHVLPEEDAVADQVDLGTLALGAYTNEMPVPASDPYLFDGLGRLAKYAAQDPHMIGAIAALELAGCNLLQLSEVAGMPSTKEYWHTYLRDVLHFDLKEVGRRYYGSEKAITSWQQVQVPRPRDFVGGEQPDNLNLVGVWNFKWDSKSVGEEQGWYKPDSAPREHQRVHCNDPMLTIYRPFVGDMSAGFKGSSDTWLCRSVEVSAGQLASLRYLHVPRSVLHGHASWVAAYLNGKPLQDLDDVPTMMPHIDLCFDVQQALKPGKNSLAIKTAGQPIPGYIFLGGVKPWTYPSHDPLKNRLYFDGVNFCGWLKMRQLEADLRAIRRGDPDRPMKVMAPAYFMDQVLDLCERYGAYPHDTGGSATSWTPWLARYAIPRGAAYSSEPGIGAWTVPSLQTMVTMWLMHGDDAVDLADHPDLYRINPGHASWISENRELMRCIGKMVMTRPQVGVLRSVRDVRLNSRSPWQWDVGRGELQQVGRIFNYADLPDVTSGRIGSWYKVLFDDGTEILSEEEVAGLVRRQLFFPLNDN
jgi:hypothetical protein